MEAVNYDQIAGTYDQRYESAYKPDGIASKLTDLVRELKAEEVLEVGCGTGHWLELLQEKAKVVGIDLSWGMLQKAAVRKGKYFLVKGDIDALPFTTQEAQIWFIVSMPSIIFKNPLKIHPPWLINC